jgi:hypothetical protein
MTDDARHQIAESMISRLADRLPGLTRTQRLALLRLAFSELRHRCFARPDPVAVDDATGKPLPPSPNEAAFTDVGDLLLDEMAAILAERERPSA